MGLLEVTEQRRVLDGRCEHTGAVTPASYCVLQGERRAIQLTALPERLAQSEIAEGQLGILGLKSLPERQRPRPVGQTRSGARLGGGEAWIVG